MSRSWICDSPPVSKTNFWYILEYSLNCSILKYFLKQWCRRDIPVPRYSWYGQTCKKYKGSLVSAVSIIAVPGLVKNRSEVCFIKTDTLYIGTTYRSVFVFMKQTLWGESTWIWKDFGMDCSPSMKPFLKWCFIWNPTIFDKFILKSI